MRHICVTRRELVCHVEIEPAYYSSNMKLTPVCCHCCGTSNAELAEDETIIAEDETIIAEDETIIAEDETIIAEDETIIAEDETIIALRSKQASVTPICNLCKAIGKFPHTRGTKFNPDDPATKKMK